MKVHPGLGPIEARSVVSEETWVPFERDEEFCLLEWEMSIEALGSLDIAPPP